MMQWWKCLHLTNATEIKAFSTWNTTATPTNDNNAVCFDFDLNLLTHCLYVSVSGTVSLAHCVSLSARNYMQTLKCTCKK
eukprot:m.158577 g.158577  ORF g.158577 m.158577 type:complete len:80 (-) comp31097_c1_seq2:162-401(-)